MKRVHANERRLQRTRSVLPDKCKHSGFLTMPGGRGLFRRAVQDIEFSLSIGKDLNSRCSFHLVMYRDCCQKSILKRHLISHRYRSGNAIWLESHVKNMRAKFITFQVRHTIRRNSVLKVKGLSQAFFAFFLQAAINYNCEEEVKLVWCGNLHWRC